MRLDRCQTTSNAWISGEIMGSTRKSCRAAVVLLGVLLASLTIARIAAPVVIDSASVLAAGDADPATAVASAVTLTAATALALVACWVATATTWCVVSALSAGEVRRSGRTHPALRPWLVRVLVGAALGTSTLAGPAAAAAPAPGTPPPSASTSASTPGGPAAQEVRAGTASLPRALAGLPLPDRPVGAAPAPAPPAQPAPDPAPEPTPDAHRRLHTVATGESLWSIATEHLPPTAPTVEVDRWWRAVYDANRPVIGDDPDLIRPGTVLRLPRPLA
jgi:nucleoid-associated protein YgaU